LRLRKTVFVLLDAHTSLLAVQTDGITVLSTHFLQLNKEVFELANSGSKFESILTKLWSTS
jgi:hypothetical protein